MWTCMMSKQACLRSGMLNSDEIVIGQRPLAPWSPSREYGSSSKHGTDFKRADNDIRSCTDPCDNLDFGEDACFNEGREKKYREYPVDPAVGATVNSNHIPPLRAEMEDPYATRKISRNSSVPAERGLEGTKRTSEKRVSIKSPRSTEPGFMHFPEKKINSSMVDAPGQGRGAGTASKRTSLATSMGYPVEVSSGSMTKTSNTKSHTSNQTYPKGQYKEDGGQLPSPVKRMLVSKDGSQSQSTKMGYPVEQWPESPMDSNGGAKQATGKKSISTRMGYPVEHRSSSEQAPSLHPGGLSSAAARSKPGVKALPVKKNF